MANESKNKERGTYRKERIKSSFYLVILATALLLTLLFARNIFSLPFLGHHWDLAIYRLAWCYCWCLFGLAGKSFQQLNHPQPPWKDYFFVYHTILFAYSCFIFSLLHIFSNTRGQVFYTLSIPLCVFGAMKAPSIGNTIRSAVQKVFDKVFKS